MLSDIEVAIYAFMVRDLGWEGSVDDLVGEGAVSLREVLDSEQLLETITLCEDEFGIEIADEELIPENFETLGAVARLVESKLPAE